MVGFFIKCGGPQICDAFVPFIRGEKGLERFIKAYVNANDYGEGLTLLLIKVYVEGQFEVYGPEHLTVENYSKIRGETSAAFTVHPDDFQNKTTGERKLFLTTMIQLAVEEVYRKHSKKLGNFNFPVLQQNVTRALEAYMQEPF